MRNHTLPQQGRTNNKHIMLISFLVVAFMLVPSVSAFQLCEWIPFWTCSDDVTDNVLTAGGKWVMEYSTDEDFFLWIDDPKTKRTEVCLLHINATKLNDLEEHKNLWAEDGTLIEQMNRKKKTIDDIDWYGFCRMIDNDNVDYIKFGDHSTVVTYENDTLEVTNETGHVLQDVILEENTDQCLIDCYARGRTVLYENSTMFDEFDFKDSADNIVELPNSNIYLIETTEKIASYPVYVQNCTDEETANGTIQVCVPALSCEEIVDVNGTTRTCTEVVDYYEDEIIEKETLVPYNFETLSAGTYDWIIKAKKSPESSVDWAVSFQGFDTDTIREYWAWWNSSWTYSREISNLTGEYPSLNLTAEVNAKAGWGDTRFVGDDGATELNYTFRDFGNPGGLAYANLTTGLTADLYAYYKMDATTGNLVDAHTNSDDIPELGTVPSQTGKILNARGAYTTGNYFEDLSYGQSIDNTDSWTQSMWVKRVGSVGGTYNRIFSRTDGGTGSYWVNIRLLTDHKLRFMIGSSATSTDYDYTTTNALPDGEWQHIVFSYDGSSTTAYVYVNGVLEDSATFTLSTTACSAMRVGAGLGGSAIAQNTYFDELALWDVVLTEEQINQLYNAQWATVTVDTNNASSIDWYYGNENATTTSSASDTLLFPGYVYFMDQNLDDATGGASATNNGATPVPEGNIFGSYYFDGIDDRVILPDDFIDTAGEYTVSAWISSPTLSGVVMGLMDNHDVRIYYDLGKVRWRQYNTLDLDTTTTLSADTWYHLTITRDGSGNSKLYLDGVEEASGTAGTPQVKFNDNALGYRPDTTSSYFTGNIDEVISWDRALSPTEVYEIYSMVNKTATSTIGAEQQEGEAITITITHPLNQTYNADVTFMSYTNDSNATNCFYTLDGGVTNSTPVTCGSGNFTGLASIAGVNTWKVFATYPLVGEVSDNVTFYVNKTVYVELLTPVNGGNTSTINTTFFFNTTPINDNLTNATVYVWNDTDDVLANTSTVSLSGDVGTSGNGTVFFGEGNFLWNVEVCIESGVCEFAPANFSLVSHQTPPTIEILAPIGVQDALTIGENETLVYNISEDDVNESMHIESCWYTYTENSSGQLSNSTFGALDYWFFLNGTMSNNPGDNVVRIIGVGPSSYSLRTNEALNDLYVSGFSPNIPNCISETYSQAVFFQDSVGEYACLRDDDAGEYYIVKVNAHDGTGFGTNMTSYSFEGIGTPLNCSGNTSDFLYINGRNNLTAYVKDIFGLISSATTNWSYVLLTINQTFSPTAAETSIETFGITFEYTSTDWSGASVGLWYNGTKYPTSIIGTGDLVSAEVELTVPPIEAENESLTFYWNLSLTNATGTFDFVSSTESQLVTEITFGLCGAGETPFLRFFTQDSMALTALNTTFQTNWQIYDSNGGGALVNNVAFEDLNGNKSEYEFCLSPNETNYTISFQALADAPTHTQTNYYLTEVELSGVTENITMYLLNDSFATLTQIQVIDKGYQGIEDVLVFIQRFDIGTNTYYTVDMAKTADDGTDLVYLNWYDTWYRFVLIQDGEIVKTTTAKKISATPEVIELFEDEDFTFQKFKDIQYSLVYNNATENFVLTYVLPSAEVTSGCLQVVKTNATNAYEICYTCETSASATLYCNIGSEGNGTFVANFYATGSLWKVDWITEFKGISQTVYDALGEKEATALAILFAGIVVAFFLFSAVAGVIGMLLGLGGAMALGFQPIDMTAYISICVIGIATIIILKR